MKTFPYTNNQAAQDNAIISFYESRYATEYNSERSWWTKRFHESTARAHDNAIAKMEVSRLARRVQVTSVGNVAKAA